MKEREILSCQVFYDENSAYQDPDARSRGTTYATVAEAIAECQRMVDADLDEVRKPGMASDAILAQWQMWGRDPFIIGGPEAGKVTFSAWAYAAIKAATL